MEEELEIVKYIKSKVSYVPDVLVICGSGLSHLSQAIDPSTLIVIKYEEIKGFPSVAVQGHSGELVFGNIGSTKCAMLRG